MHTEMVGSKTDSYYTHSRTNNNAVSCPMSPEWKIASHEWQAHPIGKRQKKINFLCLCTRERWWFYLSLESASLEMPYSNLLECK